MIKKVLVAFLLIALICGCSSDVNGGYSITKDNLQITKKSDCVGDDGTINIYVYGAGNKVLTPNSSYVDYIVYYSESRHLIVSLNGKEYIHANVSKQLWDRFINAESYGTFYNNNFKNNSDYWVVGYDGTNGSNIIIHFE